MAEYVTVARTTDVPPGTSVVVEVGDLPIALAHVEGDGYYAIDDLCTHDGGPLGDCDLDGPQIECPRHGAVFEMSTGKAITLPATRPVPTYEVKIEGGAVSLLLEKVEES